ncbi:BrnT family toxin [Castellaniella sp.]|uniref:BrnT family toxin n=1 Tax=Castellaniella sp. TaxID=1955812 RepID=UPI00356637BB
MRLPTFHFEVKLTTIGWNPNAAPAKPRRRSPRWMLAVACDTGVSARNTTQHQVSFAEAELVFYDPHRIRILARHRDDADPWWVTIGWAQGVFLAVAYRVMRDGTIQIVSARRVNEDERRLYAATYH